MRFPVFKRDSRRMNALYEFSIGRPAPAGTISPSLLMLKEALEPAAVAVNARGPFLRRNVMWDKTAAALIVYLPMEDGNVAATGYYPLKEEDYADDITVAENTREGIAVHSRMGVIGSLHYLCSGFRLNAAQAYRAKEFVPALFFCLDKFADKLDLYPDRYMHKLS